MPSQDWIGYTPDMWRSGHEPMTALQFQYLSDMSRKTGIDIPFITRNDGNGQRVTKAEASTLLTMLERREPVDAFFIDSLGRGEPGTQPEHPSTWWNCHESPTEWQMKWVEKLTGEIGIAVSATQKATLGITLGQAAEVVKLLRAEKDVVPRRTQTARWLDDVVTAAVEEVPLPDEVEGVDGDYDPDEDSEDSGEDEDEMQTTLGERLGRTEIRELLADAQPDVVRIASRLRPR